MEIGLLLLRLLLAAVLFTHAAQKLFGWFSGNGLGKQGDVFAAMGLRPGRAMVLAAAFSELVAAVLLGAGLGTAVGAVVAAGTMLVAGLTMHLNSGRFWNVAGGGEYPYLLSALAVVVGCTGPGSLSADVLLARQDVAPFGYFAEPSAGMGLGVAALAVLAAVPFALVVRKNRGKYPHS